MWVRQWLRDTPVFEEMQNRARLSRKLPLGAVLKSHGRTVVTSLLSTWMLTPAIVVVILNTFAFAQTIRKRIQPSRSGEFGRERSSMHLCRDGRCCY